MNQTIELEKYMEADILRHNVVFEYHRNKS